MFMNEPIGVCVSLGSCEFNTKDCAWFRISVKFYFENSDTKLFISRFVLPARYASIIVDIMNRSALDGSFGIFELYRVVGDYSLFELVLKKKL